MSVSFPQRIVLSGWKLASDFLWNNFNKKNALKQWSCSPEWYFFTCFFKPLDACSILWFSQECPKSDRHTMIRLHSPPQISLGNNIDAVRTSCGEQEFQYRDLISPTTTQPSSWGLSFSWQRWRPAPKDDDDATITYKVLWLKKRRFCNEVSGSPQIIIYLWSDPKSDCLENPAFLSFPRKAVIHQLLSFQPCSSSLLIDHRRRATPC